MRRRFGLLTGVIAVTGIALSCASGKKATDISSLTREAQYTLGASVYSNTATDIEVARENLIFIQSVEPDGKLNLISIATQQLLGIVNNKNEYRTMQGNECINSDGSINKNIDPTNNTFTVIANNCEILDGLIFTCTMAGLWEGAQNNPTYAKIIIKQGCTLATKSGSFSHVYEGDLTISYNINKIGNACEAQGYGIEATLVLNGGPIKSQLEGKYGRVSYSNLSLNTDFHCSNVSIFSWAVDGSMTYEDNFCTNTKVSLNISTDPIFRIDNSSNPPQCSGHMSINNNQMEIILNSDCTKTVKVNGNVIANTPDLYYQIGQCTI